MFQINSLFDIVVDEKSLERAEKVFYQDQRTARICRVSEEIDEDWVKEQLAILEQKQQQRQIEEQDVPRRWILMMKVVNKAKHLWI